MKTKKLFSKVLAAALAVLMLVGMLPVFASAAEERAADDTGVEGLYLNKTATLENDGTYTINLEAFSTGETLTVMKQTPTDIVLVLDVSGSMKEQLDNTRIDDGYVPATGKVSSMPKDVYHHCPDGTYSTVQWKDERNWANTGHIRFTCDHCNVTRSLRYTVGIARPDSIEEQDGWALYKKGSHYAYKLEVMQMAAKQFINEVAARNAAIADVNNQHRVSIVKFASGKMDTVGNDFNSSGYNYTQIVDNLTAVNSETAVTLNTHIDSFSAAGATSVDYGMEHAKSILDPVREEGRKQVVIVFTDGEPTHSNSFEKDVANAAIGTAKSLKDNGVTVYTIGVFDNANPADTNTNTNAYMNALSSNYPEATSYTSLGTGENKGYYKVAESTRELTDIFTQISQDINYSNVTLNADAVMKDIMGEGFVLTDNSSATAYSVPYTGPDSSGNRTFGTQQTPYTATIDKALNTVSVTGFDYSTKYLIDSNAQGEKLVVTITGVEATDPAVTGNLVSTNSALSGVYENAAAEAPAAVFPQPQTLLSSSVYVMDYAKEAKLAGLPNNVTHIAAGMNKFSTDNTALNLTYGQATTSSYTPTTMMWDGYDSFYGFGKWSAGTPEGVTTGDNAWTKVSVLPANNVYYEDTFISSGEADGTGTVGIKYTGEWNVQKEASNSQNIEDVNGGIQGWVEDLADDTGDSDGTVTMASAKAATATFKFTGTGFDVYSRTNMTSGKVYAKISWTDETGRHNKGLFVDTESASGEYYSIPTLWFSGEYGEYTVTIKVQNDAEDGAAYSYCIDGIRIYNPLAPENVDETVEEAYGEELNAYFETVRQILLDAGSFESIPDDPDTDENEAVTPDQPVKGAVFIDKDSDGALGTETNVIGTYTDYGPKNEVYLAPGNAIAFYVGDVAKLQVGLKAPEGGTVKVNASFAENKSEINVNHTTDLYYEVVPDANGFVVIRNASTDENDTLLSVTKVKFLLSDDGVAETDTGSLLMAVEEFDAKPVVAYSLRAPEPAEPETPAETETPTETETPAESETPTEPQAPDIVIDNPEPQPQPDNEAKPDRSEINARIEETLKKLFSSFRGWF